MQQKAAAKNTHVRLSAMQKLCSPVKRRYLAFETRTVLALVISVSYALTGESLRCSRLKQS
jgi:hypothetical protein